MAARAAIKDQEAAGVNVMSDGELFSRDDNRFGPPNAMIDYFAAKIPGCDVIQIDEPILWLRTKDQKWGVKAINACFEGVKHAIRAIHIC